MDNRSPLHKTQSSFKRSSKHFNQFGTRDGSPSPRQADASVLSGVKNLSDVLNSQELLKTPRSQRTVEQSPETIFKIEPILWNNVPPIVYEAVAVMIEAIDRARGQIHANYMKALAQYDESVTVRNEA
jgi:hypothetical protein